jgi:hypothetical protein
LRIVNFHKEDFWIGREQFGRDLVAGVTVEMNNALVRCKDKRETYYFGVATSKAIVGGQWVYANETYSISPKPIKCGT